LDELFSLQRSFVATVGVNVVSERNGVFAPAGHVLGNSEVNEVSEPADVSDLQLLEVEVGEEDSEMEAILEGHGVPAGALFEDNMVDGAVGLVGFVTIVLVQVGRGKELLVVGTVKGFNELLGIGACVELVHVVGVKVSQVGDELSSGGLTASGGVNIFDSERVVDDVDGPHVTLELEEVVHDTGGCAVEFLLAPLMELLEPYLSDA